MALISSLKEQLFAPLMSLYGEQEARSLWWLLLENATQQTRTQLRMAADTPIADNAADRLRTNLQRLLAQEPLQYILGEAHFYGYDFRVSPAVLIPRRETEELVHWALQVAANTSAQAPVRIVDIGTGSGCIPITLALELAQKNIPATLCATDISPSALAVAADNAQQLSADIHFIENNILSYLSETPTANAALGTFDLIISNPPYIPPQEFAEMPDNVRQHEPHLALFTPTADALIFYRALGHFAQQHLQRGGWLLVEIHEKFAAETAAIFTELAFSEIEIRHDMQGKSRMVGARWT